MNRHMNAMIAASALVFGFTLASSAVAQTAKDLEGVWTLVSADDVRPDGTRNPLYGPNPAGLLIFLPNGVYSLHVKNTTQAKFLSGDRMKATPEEYKETVLANNSHWGKYTVDEANRTLVLQIEHAMFPNWDGTTQKRAFTLTGDQLKYTSSNPSRAGTTPELVYKRVK